MFTRPEYIGDFIRYALHAHLRVLIVRRNFRGRDHVALLRLKLLLHPAVEEERYVCVFLRFCQCTLSVSRLAHRGERQMKMARERMGQTCNVGLLDALLGEPFG